MLMLLCVHVTSVLFLVLAGNSALTMDFYWSYTLLLKSPVLMRSWNSSHALLMMMNVCKEYIHLKVYHKYICCKRNASLDFPTYSQLHARFDVNQDYHSSQGVVHAVHWKGGHVVALLKLWSVEVILHCSLVQLAVVGYDVGYFFWKPSSTLMKIWLKWEGAEVLLW